MYYVCVHMYVFIRKKHFNRGKSSFDLTASEVWVHVWQLCCFCIEGEDEYVHRRTRQRKINLSGVAEVQGDW